MNAPDTILVEDRGSTRWIWFNRPEVHNAQNTSMLEALSDALADTARNREVRVLVIAGKGRSFSSGHDLREINKHPGYRAAVETVEGRRDWEERYFVRPVKMLRDLPIPTISRVQGPCVAAGLMFACATDLAVAGPGASFASPIIARMGINDTEVPALSWVLGERRAKQALWLDDKIGADEALLLGLVNWVVADSELDSFVEELAERLTRVGREVLALSKSSFHFLAQRRGWDDFAAFHFASHSLSHHTAEARHMLARRLERVDSGSSAVEGIEPPPITE